MERINIYILVFLMLFGCKKNQKQHVEEVTMKNMVFTLGSITHFGNPVECEFYFECDCCEGDLVILDSTFLYYDHCLEEYTLFGGNLRWNNDSLVLISYDFKVSDYQPIEEEETYVSDTTILPIVLLFQLQECNDKPMFYQVSDGEPLVAIPSSDTPDQIISILKKNEMWDRFLYRSSLVERFHPEEMESSSTDTLIASRDISISINRATSSSFVVQEFESDGSYFKDKYRDYVYHLVIKEAGNMLLDTIIRKEDFMDFTGKKFLDIATFHGYWFNLTEEDYIQFFGSINKPETDWNYAFYHRFHLQTREFEVVEYEEDEM